MRFGYFDDVALEYVITRPDTPLPWINYLGSDGFFGLISNCAGGYSFFRDARLRRLTRFRYNNIPSDTGGRYLYLRDNQSGEYWTPSWQPTRQLLESYLCRHGLGYTVISATHLNIETQIRYFIPPKENLEIWTVTLTNQRGRPAELSLFSFVEFCLWDAWDDATNYQRNLNIGEVEVEASTIYHKSEYRERRDHFAFFACSEPLAGFDTQRDAFLGAYGSLDRPSVLLEGESRNSVAHGWAPIGSHHVKLQLAPNSSCQITFLLGYFENDRAFKFDPPDSNSLNKQGVRRLIARYLRPQEVENAFAELASTWQKLLGVYQVSSPDAHTDRMVNIWNAYQCVVTFNMSRSASYFESGVGRGMGFRDSNQDLLGFVHMLPERARERILDIAATQLETGGAYHQYQPLTKRGNDAVGSDFNDDPLWLVLAATAYLKETADFSILEAQVPYDNQPGSETALYEHLQRSIHYTLDRLGPHGLPLIGRADWNDCLNLNTWSSEPGESFQTAMTREGEVAESVFIAGLFVLAARELADLAAHLGWVQDAQRYHQAADRMAEVTLEHGWDGAWFLRAYDAAGDQVGSQNCREGQIFIEPQGICVMAGIGVDSGEAGLALESVRQRLLTDHGLMLHQPAFSRYYLNLGEISSYPPGYKENAGIFCHTNPWIMIAEAALGNGDRAWDYYRRNNPSAREGVSEVHRSEPYVYAQMIAGRDAPTHGEAKNSWLTGTAAWNYVAITQWILGVRPTYSGLQVSPAVPHDWERFEVTRVFRGVTYRISVERVGPGNQVSLSVAGQDVAGRVIPLPPPGATALQVRAVLGSSPT